MQFNRFYKKSREYMKVSCIILLILLLSCSEIVTEANELYDSSSNPTVWICHNPESILHGHICPAIGDNGCLIEGDSSKFCWELDTSACSLPENLENIEFCREISRLEQ